MAAVAQSNTAAGLGPALEERYRLDRASGHSEVGATFEATDLITQRHVAIEVASSIGEPDAQLAWTRDALMAQRLEGEHVLQILHVGALPNGTPYVVRERALKTLAAEITDRGALPVPDAVAWTLEACEAVAEAHALGMAHGDLRLDNVYLARGPSGPVVKVAWTSAAKAERAAKADVTRDIAALGALLRALVTGRLDSADSAPTLPADIAHVVARALSDDESAFRNVADLARALAPSAPPGHGSARSVAFLLSRAGDVGASIPPSPASVPGRKSLTEEWFGRASSRRSVHEVLAPPPPNRRGAAFAIVSVALVGSVLGGCWFLSQSGKLPRWTGTAPPEDVATTHVTSGPATPSTPTVTPAVAVDETAMPVALLPNAAPEPAPPAPAPAPRAQAKVPTPNAAAPTFTPSSVDPSESPPATDTMPATATPPAPAPVDTDPAPAPGATAPADPAPASY